MGPLAWRALGSSSSPLLAPLTRDPRPRRPSARLACVTSICAHPPLALLVRQLPLVDVLGCAARAGSGGQQSPHWPRWFSLKPWGAKGEGLARGRTGPSHPGPLPAPQKLQLVLAPLHSLASRALEHGLPDPGSLLAHSFQQLDRIDSLSEQISFLEEQLGSCECCGPHARLPTHRAAPVA